MATIQQSMSLYDGVTGPLRQMQQAMALTLNTFESMQNSISENVAIDFGTQELEMARNAVNQLGAELSLQIALMSLAPSFFVIYLFLVFLLCQFL